MPQRNRGSIVDTVTLEKIPFQWEPVHDSTYTTKFGTLNVIGRRLPIRHWVGEGVNEVNLSLSLTGAGHVTMAPSSTTRYQQLVNANKTAQDNAKAGVTDSSVSSLRDLERRNQTLQENGYVLKMLNKLLKLKEPQDDTGAPHPVLLNIGPVYTGRWFLVEDVKVKHEVHNYQTMEPTEINLTIKLVEIAKGSKQ